MPTAAEDTDSLRAERERVVREFKCRMTAFFIFEDAKIVCERVYFDSATILRQITA